MNATEMAERNHRKAVRFLWCWLIGTAVASIGGNIAAAVLPVAYDRPLKGVLALIPPVVVLCAIHALALLVKANVSGRVYWSFVAGTAALAVGAFALSFVALHALALMAGIAGWVAVALPLLLDLGMALATLGLVAIGDRPQRTTRAGSGATRAQSPAQNTAPTAPQRATESAPVHSANIKAEASLRSPPAGHDGAINAGEFAPDTATLALRIAESRSTTQSAETVRVVLDALASGASINAAAAAAGVNFRTAQRIANAVAAASSPPELAAVR